MRVELFGQRCFGVALAVTLAVAICTLGAGQAYAISTTCTTPSVSAPSTLPDAQEGASYSYQVPGCGQFSASGLPSGLTISSSGVISGTAPSTVETSKVTIEASGTQDATDQAHAAGAVVHAQETVDLPLVDKITVDATSGAELTGTTNDANLAYVADSTAGKVFDFNTANPPTGFGTALTGLNFPVAVSTLFGWSGVDDVFAAQFREPEAAQAPIGFGPVPTSTSTPSTAATPVADHATCAKPDAVTTAPPRGYFLSSDLYYSCAGSGTVHHDQLYESSVQQSYDYKPVANAVPSGIAWGEIAYPSGAAVVADARNDTIAFTNGSPIPLPGCSKPANVAFDASNDIVYVACAGSNNVAMVSVTLSSLTDEGNFSVGTHPYGVAVNSSGNELVVTNSGDGTADVISLSGTPTILYTPSVGTLPDGVTIVGNEAFIADEMGGTVYVIDPPTHGLNKKLTITHPHPHFTITYGGTSHSRRARASVARQVIGDPLIAPLPKGA